MSRVAVDDPHDLKSHLKVKVFRTHIIVPLFTEGSGPKIINILLN